MENEYKEEIYDQFAKPKKHLGNLYEVEEYIRIKVISKARI